MSLNRRAFEIAALCVALCVVGAMLWMLRDMRGLIVSGQPIFGDFIAFWSAGKLALAGEAARVHDAAAIAAVHQEAIPGLSVRAPWNSPPTFLLVMTPLALLPYPLAALMFLSVSLAFYFVAARKLLPDKRALIFAATLPAAVFQLGSVQTGLLIAGVTGLVLHWLDARPRVAGALVGLLAIKPHLALLWPVLLLLSGRWRAFAAAILSTGAFVVAAGFAFGCDAYVRFAENLAQAQTMIGEGGAGAETYASLYGHLRGFGAEQRLAFGVHLISAIGGLVVAAWTFRRGEREAQGAALCAATMLLSPYLFFYDATLLGVGAALLGVPRDRVELTASVLAWSAGLTLAIGYLVSFPLTPLAAWLLLWAAWRRGAACPTKTEQAPARSAQNSRRAAA